MQQCHKCEGFVPAQLTTCPHCAQEAPQPNLLQSLRKMSLKHRMVAAAGTGALMFTLMACYGGPPQAYCETVDNDKDGYVVCKNGEKYPGHDCNDNDKSIHPGAADKSGDNIDQNCDGVDGVAQ